MIGASPFACRDELGGGEYWEAKTRFLHHYCLSDALNVWDSSNPP